MLREQRNHELWSKAWHTPKLKTKAKATKNQTKQILEGKKNKNQKKGLKGDASDLAIYLIFLFSEQTLRALREDRVANENESAFNSQQKTSSVGTQIFLREGWTANYKELK